MEIDCISLTTLRIPPVRTEQLSINFTIFHPLKNENYSGADARSSQLAIRLYICS